MIYDLIIIGGGPAGLFAANVYSQTYPEKKGLLLEKNPTLGKKLLLSGSGQCNFTSGQPIYEMVDHYGDKKSFVKFAMKAWTNKDVMAYFESKGLPYVIREDQKVFPKDLKAESLLRCLEDQILGAFTYRCRCPVKTLEKTQYKGKALYRVGTPEGTYLSKNVIVATGGKSYPSTGSQGEGYDFAKALGHRIVLPRPGLTGVVLKGAVFKDLKGVTLKDCQLRHCGRLYQGDLLLTPFGLSGPVVINNSRQMAGGDKLYLNFIQTKLKDLEAEFIKNAARQGKMTLRAYFNQLALPKRLKDLLLEATGIEGEKRLSEISKAHRQVILKTLTDFEVEIEDLRGFKTAMVTVGGVATEEVNKKTMASKYHEGLFFIGEVLDVDGDTGGYNFQFAFSSGYVAAKAAGLRED